MGLKHGGSDKPALAPSWILFPLQTSQSGRLFYFRGGLEMKEASFVRWLRQKGYNYSGKKNQSGFARDAYSFTFSFIIHSLNQNGVSMVGCSYLRVTLRGSGYSSGTAELTFFTLFSSTLSSHSLQQCLMPSKLCPSCPNSRKILKAECYHSDGNFLRSKPKPQTKRY